MLESLQQKEPFLFVFHFTSQCSLQLGTESKVKMKWFIIWNAGIKVTWLYGAKK